MDRDQVEVGQIVRLKGDWNAIDPGTQRMVVIPAGTCGEIVVVHGRMIRVRPDGFPTGLLFSRYDVEPLSPLEHLALQAER